MITIPLQFQGKNTYIVGSLIKNGCQTFKIEDLDEVCKVWRVPNDTKEAVREAYKENSQTEEDWKSLAKYGNWSTRILVAKQGKCLDILVNDPHRFVRYTVARQGYGLDILVNDPCWEVRAEVAEQGYDLDILVNDPEQYVRVAAQVMATKQSTTA